MKKSIVAFTRSILSLFVSSECHLLPVSISYAVLVALDCHSFAPIVSCEMTKSEARKVPGESNPQNVQSCRVSVRDCTAVGNDVIIILPTWMRLFTSTLSVFSHASSRGHDASGWKNESREIVPVGIFVEKEVQRTRSVVYVFAFVKISPVTLPFR